MTVTKQQQLEWLAKECHTWKGRDFILVSDTELGYRLPVTAGCHLITREEWQQERDRMSSKPEVGGSWYELGEFPPVGAICEMIDDKNTWLECEIISHKDGACIGWISSRKAPFYTDDKSEFRPLRTELEKAIDEMMSLVMDGLMSHEMAKEFVIKMHDAGYCKVKP